MPAINLRGYDNTYAWCEFTRMTAIGEEIKIHESRLSKQTLDISFSFGAQRVVVLPKAIHPSVITDLHTAT